MDSVKPGEQEWIYAEPFGWQEATTIDRDFDVRLTLVPHAAGRGRYADTVAKLDSEAGTWLSAFQKQGGPPIDTDGDGLPDLAELALGTNPACPDTDMDGIPDGQDPEPLRGDPPRLELALPRFTAEPTSRPQSRAEVKLVHGAPAIVIDGKPYGPMIYTRLAGTLPQLAEMASHHFAPALRDGRQRRLAGPAGRRFPTARRAVAPLPGRSAQCARDAAAVRLQPAALLRLSGRSAALQRRRYAAFHRLVCHDRPAAGGAGLPELCLRGLAPADSPKRCGAYVTHVRQSDYARNIIGYFVCGGGTEEWYYWGDYDHKQYCSRLFAPHAGAFRTYLRQVRRRRGQAPRGLGRIPGPISPRRCRRTRRRRSTAAGVFWDPVESQRMQDYYYMHNKAMEDGRFDFRPGGQASVRPAPVGGYVPRLPAESLAAGRRASDAVGRASLAGH